MKISCRALLLCVVAAALCSWSNAKPLDNNEEKLLFVPATTSDVLESAVAEPGDDEEKRIIHPDSIYGGYNIDSIPWRWRPFVKTGKRELNQNEKKRWLGFLASLAAPHVINHAKKLLGRELNEEEKRGWFNTIGQALIPHINHILGKRELETPQQQKRWLGFMTKLVAPHLINHAKKLLGRELNEEEKRGWFTTIGKALVPHIANHLFGKRELEPPEEQKRWLGFLASLAVPHAIKHAKKLFGRRELAEEDLSKSLGLAVDNDDKRSIWYQKLNQPMFPDTMRYADKWGKRELAEKDSLDEFLDQMTSEQKRSWFKIIGKHVMPHAIDYAKNKWFGGK